MRLCNIKIEIMDVIDGVVLSVDEQPQSWDEVQDIIDDLRNIIADQFGYSIN